MVNFSEKPWFIEELVLVRKYLRL